MKPLDMKHFQEDTMLMRQQRLCEKNHIEKFEWLKRKMVEAEIQNERDEYFMIYGNFSAESYLHFPGEATDGMEIGNNIKTKQ